MALTRTTPRLAYRVAGEGGSPVLLIMGLAMRGLVWRPQVDAFAKRHRVVTYDNRGVGGSDPIRGLLTIRQMSADALRLADELQLESFHLVGVSMGGMIAQEAALAAPERIKSLTLIATHAGGRGTVLPPRQGLRTFLEVNAGGDRAERVAALARLLYPPEFLASVDREELEERMRERTAQRVPRRTVVGHVSAVMRHRTDDRLHRLDAPTLLIKPGRDILVRPEEVDRLKRLIPHAELVEYPDAGHGITFQRAADLNERVLSHFAEND
jgi:pimeloyl-ACP methyl ester carboxylesterase